MNRQKFLKLLLLIPFGVKIAKAMNIYTFTDRYQVLGIPYPSPETMCEGQCEGTGWVPIAKNESNPKFKALWEQAEKENPSDDGWHFVKCPDCNGTGLA